MKRGKSLLSICLLAFVALSSSCVTTEISEPDSVKSDEELLVLNLNAHDAMATRADAGYKLRYVAKLWQAESSAGISYGDNFQRQEIAGDDTSEKGNKNQIIFKVDPNKFYSILVFADYIPVSHARKDNGCYDDYFYNTNDDSHPTVVAIRPTPGNKSSQYFSEGFFNNDNYDCFLAEKQVVDKKEKEEVLNLTLSRLVSKVIFRDNGANTGKIKITPSKLNIGYQCDMKDVQFHGRDEYKFSNVSFECEPNSDRDLFYFYTLATGAENKIYMNFSASKDTASESFQVTGIPVKRNYKTIVKGAYIASDTPSVPDEPDTNPDTPGDIILNLSTDNDWEQTPLSN